MRVYEEKSIPQEMKKVILEAAAQAPTAGCQQLYTILDITDEELKKALSETCDYQPFIAKAPMVPVSYTHLVWATLAEHLKIKQD